MSSKFSVDQDEILISALKLFEESDKRIGKITVSGHDLWVKRPEKQKLLNRLQKGPALAAFNREISALDTMRKIGAPVPDTVFRTRTLIVFPDVGPTLESILRNQVLPESERKLAHEKAAVALAALHRAGISHGRPLLRDICWDGQQVTFLDFENYRESKNNLKDHARDLVWFLFSMYAQRNTELPEIDAAVAAYRSADTNGVWEVASQWARRNRWLDWVTRPIQLRAYPHALEFKAIPMVLDHLTDTRSKLPT